MARDSIWLSNADGSNVVQLTRGPGKYDGSPRWSPDGKQIAFSSARFGSPNVFAMHSNGSHVRELTHNTHNNFEPTYSPNGKLITYMSNLDGHYNVWVMNAGGSHQHRVTTGSGEDDPVFSLDGKLIAFDTGGQLFTIHTNGSHQHPLTHPPAGRYDEFPHFGLVP